MSEPNENITSLVENYTKAKEAIYEHVGFTEDWVVYPLEFYDQPWLIVNNEEVKFFDSIEAYQNEDDEHTYSHEIYTHRFYPKWVYEGKDLTLIIVDTHTDGNKFFAVFLNSKRIAE